MKWDKAEKFWITCWSCWTRWEKVQQHIKSCRGKKDDEIIWCCGFVWNSWLIFPIGKYVFGAGPVAEWISSLQRPRVSPVWILGMDVAPLIRPCWGSVPHATTRRTHNRNIQLCTGGDLGGKKSREKKVLSSSSKKILPDYLIFFWLTNYSPLYRTLFWRWGMLSTWNPFLCLRKFPTFESCLLLDRSATLEVRVNV